MPLLSLRPGGLPPCPLLRHLNCQDRVLIPVSLAWHRFHTASPANLWSAAIPLVPATAPIAQTPAARAALVAVGPMPCRYNIGTPQTPPPARPVFVRDAAPSPGAACVLLANPFKRLLQKPPHLLPPQATRLTAQQHVELLSLRPFATLTRTSGTTREASKFALLCNKLQGRPRC